MKSAGQTIRSRNVRFNKIAEDIKSVKIQGARDIAGAVLKAYSLVPTKTAKRELLSLRPTEPMMKKVLDLAEKKYPLYLINTHFDEAQNEINKFVFSLIKNKDIILIHCHSTNVINSLIYAKKKGKKFQVYNTETRPLFQGRKTAKELKENRIEFTMFIDSALGVIISGEQGNKKPDKVFLGADAITKKGAINKIGSEIIAKLAKQENIPTYIIADSWKFTRQKIPLENRGLNEIWDRAPKGIKIKNPAFEFVDKKYISKIVTELGVMKFDEFLKKV